MAVNISNAICIILVLVVFATFLKLSYVVYLAIGILVYWLVKKLPAAPEIKKASEVYQFSTLRNISIILLILSPFIYLSFFLMSIVQIQAYHNYLILSWSLWLILSSFFIIYKKTTNPGLILLTLIPFAVTIILLIRIFLN